MLYKYTKINPYFLQLMTLNFSYIIFPLKIAFRWGTVHKRKFRWKRIQAASQVGKQRRSAKSKMPCNGKGIVRWENELKTNKKWNKNLFLYFVCLLCLLSAAFGLFCFVPFWLLCTRFVYNHVHSNGMYEQLDMPPCFCKLVTCTFFQPSIIADDFV